MKPIRLSLLSLFAVIVYLYSTLATALNVELIETSPKSPAVLYLGEAIYVLIHYKSDQPLRFQAMGKNLNQQISKEVRLNPSQAYFAGEGDAIAWVAYDKPTYIDTITVTVYDEKWKPLQTKSMLLSAIWQEGSTGQTHPQSPWVKLLNQQQQARVKQQEPSSIWGMVFVQLLFFSTPLYWILQIILIFKWSGRWRTMACLPLLVSIPLLAYTLYALYASSNLWPLMMIFITPFALLFLLILMGVKYSRRD
ncbi:hypothetical protein [Legionella maioricensis]|uniref:Transmembrane protein n=1 Tax=Legionella maioricensis TaxID=2896528 RepID=A0A9X2D348_9GAMM|nr:hypothetical protein [Legionella maioricensis]MCL9685840.1 hypothetical protein [Legionella maioricensis]MCL9689246.1 hypothetical protein [Legionella maioricensis]